MSQQVNLYTEAFRKREKPFAARTMGLALGIVALGLVALYAYALVQTRSAERASAQAAQRLAEQRAQLAAAAAKLAPQVRSGGLEAEVKRLEAEVQARRAVLASLGTGQLGNTEGFSAYLAAFGKQAMPGLWLTAVSIGEAGDELQLRGRVLRPELVPAYLKALNDEPVMRGRRVVEMQLAAKSSPTPKPGAQPEPPKRAAVQEPARYIEFSLQAPRVLPEPPTAATGAKGMAK